MRDQPDEIARQLAALEEPEPPAALRERALTGARDAWARPPDRWLALWESRPLRLAWAAAVVALAAANVAVRANSKTGARLAARPAAPHSASRNRELQAIVGLPRIRAEYLEIGGTPPAPPQKAPAPRPHHGSEDRS